jgi:hypothetical protein
MAEKIPKNPLSIFFHFELVLQFDPKKNARKKKEKKHLPPIPGKQLPKKGSKLKTGDKVSIELVVGPTTPCLNVKIDYLVVPMNSIHTH